MRTQGHTWVQMQHKGNVMTTDEAKAAWREFYEEMDERLGDARPKLKSYEATLIIEKARAAVIAAYPSAASAEALREVAFEPFKKLAYLKSSRFSAAAHV